MSDGYEPFDDGLDDCETGASDPWYIWLYYWLLIGWDYLSYNILRLDRIGVRIRRLTNTHAKWCCTRYAPTKNAGCCCQRLYED
jgi:hypothetical protein